MPENPYHRDAVVFARQSLALIAREANGDEVYTGLFLSALSIERVMKGILWNVNPAFTLKDASFKNAAPVLYGETIKVIGSKVRDEIAEKPNRDVISFRQSVLRSGLFSKAVDNHRGPLLKLANCRDVIAHCNLADIDSDDSRLFLLGGVFPLFQAFAKEKEINLTFLSQAAQLRLDTLGIEYTADIEKRVEKRLERHRRIIKQKSAREIDHIAHLPHPKCTTEQWDEFLDCPACGLRSYVRFEVDFDVEDGKATPVGSYASFFSCPYCELRVEDFEELDYLGITLDRFQKDDFSGF